MIHSKNRVKYDDYLLHNMALMTVVFFAFRGATYCHILCRHKV